jgi:hypothetical protein
MLDYPPFLAEPLLLAELLASAQDQRKRLLLMRKVPLRIARLFFSCSFLF